MTDKTAGPPMPAPQPPASELPASGTPAPGLPSRDGRRVRKASRAHRLQYVAVRAAAAVFRLVPVDVASPLMGYGWRIVAPRLHRHRRALAHLKLALPELDEAERERIARDMWEHLGRVMAEALVVDRLVEAPERVELPADFPAVVERAQGGAILPTLHLGNWEVAPIGPRLAGLSLAAVYQPIRNPLVERYLKTVRAPAFPGGLFPKGAATGRKLIALAKARGAIGLVADIRENRGVEVTFFGEPATATPLPALLARLGGVPLLAGAMVRTKGVRFRYLVEEVDVPVTDDRNADIALATQRLHDVFERWIRDHPGQWMWAHRKWVATASPGSDPVRAHRRRPATPSSNPANTDPERETDQ